MMPKDNAIGVILRAPGLFIIDYWWWFQKHGESSTLTQALVHFALLTSLVLLILPQSLLRTFYSHLLCFLFVGSAHALSYAYVREGSTNVGSLAYQAADAADHLVTEVVTDPSLLRQFLLLILHVVIALVVSCALQSPYKPMVPIIFCYSLPVMARMAHIPSESVKLIHDFSFAVMCVICLRFFVTNSTGHIYSAMTTLKGVYRPLVNTVTSFQALIDFLVSTISRIFAPSHFLVFWIISFCYRIVYQNEKATTRSSHEPNLYLVFLSAAANICSTPVSLIATTVTVSYASFCCLYLFKKFINTSGPRPILGPELPEAPGRPSHSGWEEGVTTLTLSILTGITEMKPEARMSVLTIILFVILSSLLQSMMELAEPIILSLSAYHGRNFFHHIKVLFICGFLFFFPLHLSLHLAQIFHNIDFWISVVLSTSILTSVQVLELVTVHCLLWYDATRSEPWNSLDEVVYYVRGITKVLEFFVAVSVVLVGLHEGPWSWTNAFILTIHCYFNVCQRLQQGLRSFLSRRRAVQKSANLPEATAEQLKEYHDVCAICFMEMVSPTASAVTPCSHYFHRVCLRRWLSFQDRCPLCATSVLGESTSTKNPSISPEQEEIGR